MVRIYFLLLLLLLCIGINAQPPVNRGTASITAVDQRLYVGGNLRVPVYQDTTAANLNLGIDSVGTQIYTRTDTTFWGRKINSTGTKYWSALANGSSSLVENIGIKISSINISSNTPSFKSVPEMRTVPAVFLDTGTIYWRNTRGTMVPYKWSDTSTATDDSVTVIQRTGTATGRFILYFDSYVPGSAFDLDPTGVTDCSYQMQKAIDFTVNNTKNSRAAKLVIPAGAYSVKNLFIKKYSSATEYTFVTMTIEGAAPVHDVTQSLGAITVFNNTDKESFTLGVQKGRNIFIKNIAFTGAGNVPGSVQQVIEWTDEDWLAGGVRNNQFSPHAGFVVDPFHEDVATDDRYPDMGGYYTNAQGGGSSEIVLEGCAFRNFVAGVMISPNSHTQNCDNIVFRDGSAYGNKIFWASGQNQSRANSIVNLYSFGGTQFLVNCSAYGDQQGSAPNIVQSNIAGSHKYVYDINGGFAGMNITDTYFESLWSIGRSGSMPITIKGCHIALMIPNLYDVWASPILAEGTDISFIGGSIDYFDNENCAILPFYITNSISFFGTKIRAGVPYNKQYAEGKVSFRAVDLSNGDGTSRIDEGSTVNSAEISNSVHTSVVPEMKFRLLNGFQMEAVNEKIEISNREGATVYLTDANKTAWFISSNPNLYRLRDGIVEPGATTDWDNDIYTASQTTLGWVYEISGDTIKLNYPPYGLADSTLRSIYVARIPRWLPRIIGDVEFGSDTIRNVQTWGNVLQVGNRLNAGSGQLLPGTYITAIVDDKIAISTPAAYTQTNDYFYDANMRITAAESTPPTANDIIIYPNDYYSILHPNTGAASDSIVSKVAIVAGINGGSPLPIWKSISFNNPKEPVNGLSYIDDIYEFGLGGALTRSTLITGGDDEEHSLTLGSQNDGKIKTISMRTADSTNIEADSKINISAPSIKFDTRENVTDPGAFIAQWQVFGARKSFMRPNGNWKYVQLDISAIVDDSTLVNQHRVKQLINDTIDALRADGGLGRAYFRNGRGDWDTLLTNPGTDTFLIKSLNFPEAGPINWTKTTTDSTIQYSLTLDGSGGVSTYSPTLTSVTNIAGSTTAVCYYSRVGDWIHVWGSIQIDCTTGSATASQLDIELPIASDITAVGELSGTATSGETSTACQVSGSIANDRAVVTFLSPSTNNQTYSFHFSYRFIAL